MPPPFQKLTVDEFAELLKRFPFRRQIHSVHMHHTWRPSRAQFKGYESIASMWRFHTNPPPEGRGFSDIAQHLTIDPYGGLWTGRDWNASPASAKGHNGTSVGGPFMFEIIGDFDRGQEMLDGVQKTAVLDVIKLVQDHFKLGPESLLFHNQMSDKSCPGTSIDRNAFITELRSHPIPTTAAARAGGGGPFPTGALALNQVVDQALDRLRDRIGLSRATDPPDVELEYGDERRSALTAMARGGARGGDGDFGPEVLDELRPHVINMRMGQFSSEGLLSTSSEDVDAIFEEHLPQWMKTHPNNGVPARIVLFAHGGLVSESSGLEIVLKHKAWWEKNGVYPIYFVWETGFFETIGQILERTRRRGTGDVAGQRGWATDWLTDPVIEEGVRALQMERIWGAMKESARLASQPGGAGTHVATKLGAFWKAWGTQAELHAVGHSAGSIFHAHFLRACLRETVPVKSLQLLAPAITCADFLTNVKPLVGSGLGHVTLFTMSREFERADNCAMIYRKSLLYLVSEAAEPKRKTPILGLEESLRRDATLKNLFGLGAPSPLGEVVWSKSASGEGRSASQSTTHGGFDDDPPTLNSVARRILGKSDTDPIEPYVPGGGSRGPRGWTDEVDWPPVFDRLPRIPIAPAGAGNAGAPMPIVVPPGSPSGGSRRAVCVGIDEYPSNPLYCCVADTQLWAQTLRALGFDVGPPIMNQGATRAGILSALTNLIRESRAGDTLVFQYSGHGTQVDDLDGDEVDDRLDEALCPVDYESGALLIDDDIKDCVTALPEGVRLTFLMDCCHSGTTTRFAGAFHRGAGSGARMRFIRPTPQLLEAHRRFRSGQRGFAGSRAARGGEGMREVTFAACQPEEVAWEMNGQGEFTRRAHEVMRGGTASLTNAGFYEAVMLAFGANPRQRPFLDCDPARRGDPWLGLGSR
jgi:caspase domain-containing protein/N-acetylmuramoyl-L-alanine amidase-like protein